MQLVFWTRPNHCSEYILIIFIWAWEELSIFALEYTIIEAVDLNIYVSDTSAWISIKFNEIISASALKNIIEQPNRYGPSSAWHNHLFHIIIILVKDNISDYCVILWGSKSSSQPFLYTFRHFSKFDENLFIADITNEGFERTFCE